MRYGLTLIVILFFTFCTIGQVYYEKDNTIDIYNFSDNITAQIRDKFDDIKPINLSNSSIENRGSDRIVNFVTYSISYYALCITEFMGFGLEYGFNHPKANYMLLAKIIIWLCIISILAQLFIPLCVLIYLGCIGIKKLKKRYSLYLSNQKGDKK